jgi:hypothetical protein
MSLEMNENIHYLPSQRTEVTRAREGSALSFR